MERRRHARVNFSCEMALMVEGEYLSCQARNVAVKGVLTRVQCGDMSVLQESATVACWLEYNGQNFEANCKVIRIVGKDVALMFLDLNVDQADFIKELITENSE